MRKEMIRLFGAAMLVAGMHDAFASCLGTVYVKLPDSWTTSYIYYSNQAYRIPATATKNGAGFVLLDLAEIIQPQLSMLDDGVVIVNNTQVDMPAPQVIEARYYDVAESRSDFSRSGTIPCPGAEGIVYVSENPKEEGVTVIGSEPPDSKVLHFLAPAERGWIMTHPAISMDDGKTWKSMTPEEERCGWFSYTWFGENPTDKVVIAPAENDGGVAAYSLPLASYFSVYGVQDLFYVPDESLWMSDDDWGLYVADPQIDGICSYSIGALIYDTDASLHPSFSCDEYYGGGFYEGCQVGVKNPVAGIDINEATAVEYVKNCIGVQSGIVADTLGPDKKPHLSNSENARMCFPNAQIFDMLFNYTPTVNEMSCYELPFSRTSNNFWEFNSDYYHSYGAEPAIPGGFYPVEKTDDVSIIDASPTQTPVAAARTKRMAQGPAFMVPYMRAVDPASGEDMPRMDLVCNSSTWKGGHDCEGMYASGEDLVTWYPSTVTGTSLADVWCWGSYCAELRPKGWPLYQEGTGMLVGYGSSNASPRWGTDRDGADAVKRNQHYCFESHAQFVYRPGQRFAFRGDDDIWVFIDNKLAVDIGGTHLAAPGYVILEKFEGKSGMLVPGNTYDFDLFFCDRRTTMTNVRIYSNIYFEQKSKVEFKKSVDSADGSATYEACVIDFHDKDCVSRLGPYPKMDTVCGKDIPTELMEIRYSLVRTDGTMILEEDEMTNAAIYKGGIDLTDRKNPKIDVNKMELGPGKYNLIVSVNGKTNKIPFTVGGGLDIASRNAYSVLKTGNGIDKYLYVSAVKAGEKAPLYISYVVDPCEEGDSECDSPLEFKPDYAVGVSYKLDVPADLTVYLKDAKGEYSKIANNQSLVAGVTGVDTVYVALESSEKENTYKIGLAGRTMKASVRFNAAKSEQSEDFDVDITSSSSAKSNTSSSSSSSKDISSSSKGGDDSESSVYAAPSFRVKLTGPFTFTIVFNDSGEKAKKNKKFAVMDLMGGVVVQGETAQQEASVSLRNAGSYIVRVGHDSRVVNIKMAEED